MRILILFFIVLGSVCHAELRTWTAVNGKEVEAEFVSNEKGIVKLKLKSGKVFEVPADKLSKEDNEIISFLAKPEKINPNPEGVNQDELEEREGISYLKGSGNPYTGKTFVLNENGQKKYETNYKDGKRDGLFVRWYENGERVEANYKDGKLDGLTTTWYENGQKAGERNYKDGKGDGLAVMWHKNGQKLRELNYKDGKKISEKYLNSKGEPLTALEQARRSEAALEQARRSEANNEVTQIKNAISAYELEYSKLPFASGTGGEGDLQMDSFQDNIISVLSGYNVDGLNPRKKPFYQGKRAKDAKTSKKPKGGVFGTDEQLQLSDPWGREYYIKIDSNYDNILEDLPGAEDEEVRASVAVWTRGKPKDGEDLPKDKWLKSW